MGFGKGSRVVATRGLGGSIFTKVPEGTRGTILAVKSTIWETTYVVKWENGEILEANAKALHQL